MAEAAVEQIEMGWGTFQEEMVPPPLVIPVPEMLEDVFTRAQAGHFIGRVLAEKTLEAPESHAEHEPGFGSLAEAIWAASEGDETGRRLVAANTLTDAVERTIKTGMVTEVELEVDDNDEILQHTQTMSSIQANSLRYASANPVLMERSQPEARNSFRIKNTHKQRLLGDYAFVVISRTPDLPKRQVQDNGFFAETLSCSIQATTAEGGKIITQSAFVSGVAAEGEARHDAAAVVELGARLGVDLEGKTAAEIIDYPLLVHKSLMPNGVVDLVALYDECAGGTFFGERRPRQDYVTYAQECKQRETQFKYRSEQIADQLISEAATIRTPLQATKRLNTLSGSQMVEQAIEDSSIDARVFGAVSAYHIEEARRQHQAGQHDAARASMSFAKANDKSSSCPSALKRALEAAGNDDADTSESEGEGKDEYVKMTCPICGDKNQWGWKCGDKFCTSCRSSVVKGKVTIGRIPTRQTQAKTMPASEKVTAAA